MAASLRHMNVPSLTRWNLGSKPPEALTQRYDKLNSAVFHVQFTMGPHTP